MCPAIICLLHAETHKGYCAGADTMPQRQLEKAISSELGADWRSLVADFDDEPLAAASIGQVHLRHSAKAAHCVLLPLPNMQA